MRKDCDTAQLVVAARSLAQCPDEEAKKPVIKAITSSVPRTILYSAEMRHFLEQWLSFNIGMDLKPVTPSFLKDNTVLLGGVSGCYSVSD